MNIQQYYKQTALVALNDGLVALLFPVMLTIICIRVVVLQKFIIFIIPFLVFSFVSFSVYLLNQYRSRQVSWQDNDQQGSLFSCSDYLIAFLPAPKIHLLIFHPNGKMIGEIKEQKQLKIFSSLYSLRKKSSVCDYALYDEAGFLEGRFQVDNRNKRRVHVYNSHNEEVGYCLNEKRKKQHVMKCRLKTDEHNNCDLKVTYSRLSPNFIVNDKRKGRIAYLQKGWLPMEWTKRFKDSNTPLLTVDPHTTNEEKLLIFGFLSLYFNQYHH